MKVLIVCLFLFLNLSNFKVKADLSEAELENNTSVFNDIPSSIKVNSDEEYKKLLNTTDVTYLVFYYKRVHHKSQVVAGILSNIGKKLEYLASILMVDCASKYGSELKECENSFSKPNEYPKVKILSPPLYRFNPYTKKMNNYEEIQWPKEYDLVEGHIYNFMTMTINSRSSKLMTDNIEMFTSQDVFNKVILFSDKPKTPLIYRGLSNHFYDRILFGEVDKSETALINKFKIKKYPTLLVYQTHEGEIKLDEPKINYYEGKINVKEIAEFIEQYCLTHKTYLKSATKEDILKKEKVQISLLTADNYKNVIQTSSVKRLIISFTKDGEFPEDLNNFTKQTK